MSRFLYVLCGAGVGLLLMFLGFGAAGGGHGTPVLLVLFFAPSLVLFGPLVELLGRPPEEILILSCALLYPAYAFFIHWGGRSDKADNVFIMVMVFHLWALAWSAIIYALSQSLETVSAFAWICLAITDIPLILAIIAAVQLMLKYPIGLDKRKQNGKYCRQCKYNLTGNVSGVCPECGTPIVPVIPPPQPYQPPKGLVPKPGHSHRHRRK